MQGIKINFLIHAVLTFNNIKLNYFTTSFVVLSALLHKPRNFFCYFWAVHFKNFVQNFMQYKSIFVNLTIFKLFFYKGGKLFWYTLNFALLYPWVSQNVAKKCHKVIKFTPFLWLGALSLTVYRKSSNKRPLLFNAPL